MKNLYTYTSIIIQKKSNLKFINIIYILFKNIMYLYCYYFSGRVKGMVERCK